MRNKLKIFFFSLITLISFLVNTLYAGDIKSELGVNTFFDKTGNVKNFFKPFNVESFPNTCALTTTYEEIFNLKKAPEENHPGKYVQRDYYYCITPFLESLEEEKYSETSLRRFEIIFIISVPVALGFSFIGVLGYRAISGKVGPLSPEEYRYLVLSTTGICFSIALNDYRVMHSGEYK